MGAKRLSSPEDAPSGISKPGDPVSRAELRHSINDPLAALVGNLDLAAEVLARLSEVDGAAEASHLLKRARQSADRIRIVASCLEGAAVGEPPPPSAATTVITAEEPPTNPASGRVLVVDDEAGVIGVLRRALRGFDVTSTSSAKDALARLAGGERFDVIMLDLMMPGMTGMDLFEELVRLAPDQAQRVVFMTAGPVTTRARDFVATTLHPVVSKPFDVQKVRDLIRDRVLGRPQGVVLVVDDDEAARSLVVRWLKNAGIPVGERASGREAVEAVVADPQAVEAIVLDISMPEVDGFDVVAQLKANPETSSIPVLIATAEAIAEADVTRGLEAGAVDYLTKPFAGKILVAKVRAACARGRAERELRRRLQFAEEYATTDSLTGLMNRRAFDARFTEASANAARHREPVALVMLDLDHFKQVNDTFGHVGGDRMLLYFARSMRRAIRVGDQAFRYGGEEFALILPKCDAEGAARVVARLQEDLRARPFAIATDKTAVARFSAGIAAATAGNDFCLGDLAARADAALYRAKRGGRDRIEVAES
jgi:diguanylate cyclase (GGDEF)-like protein